MNATAAKKEAAPKAAKAAKTKASKKSGGALVNPKFYDLIRRPVITEKATMASEFGKVVFHVSECADKPAVKNAVEALFGVKVEKVNILNVKGKTKRFKGMNGQRNGYKKAVVTLADGQTIDAMAGVR